MSNAVRDMEMRQRAKRQAYPVLTRVALGLCLLSLISPASALASTGRSDAPRIALTPVAAAQQACRSNAFDSFFRLYVQYPEVRARFTASQIHSASPDASSGFVSGAEFLGRFPLVVHGWNYAFAGASAPGETRQYVLASTRHPSRTAWHVDWIAAKFDTSSANGKWIGVPVKLTGVPMRLDFGATDDGCWHLTEAVTAPKDTPFQPGIQSLHCAVRIDDADRYQRELRRVASRLDDHPDDMGVGRDLAACAKLHGMIEAAIRDDPDLTRLSRAITHRLAALGARQTSAARSALALDQQRFQRSLMRDQNILLDGSTENRDLHDDLAGRLALRLDLLGRIKPRQSDFSGSWSNVSGTIDISRQQDGTYEVDASLADPYFLGWTCEFDEAMPRSGNMLSRTYPLGDSLRLILQDGILVVEQEDAGSDYCGAGGSLRGAYFPSRPRPELPPQSPIFENFENSAANGSA